MERIGEYLVKRMVGEGGMGKVYEAEERLSKRKVALKVLRPELTKSDDGRRLFLNEMQILAHLEHPYVVRSLASMEVDGQLVMVLEYLSGHTLREELTRRGKLPWHEAVELVSKMAEALGAAHGQTPPIIHRDLKPENVMLLEGGGLKVMDFGIAKVLQAVHATNTQSIGTLQYMSPEQIDAHTIDARSDLYSLGLIFYELLAGSPPFHSASPRELLNLQCTAAAPALDDDVRATMPRGVEELLFELLEKSPDDRPAGAAEVAERLSPFRAAVDKPARRSEKKPASAPTTQRDADGERAEEEEAAPRTNAKSGDTLHSTPHDAVVAKKDKERDKPSGKASRKARDREPAPRTDTVALVEKATEAREVTTSTAILVIVGFSLLAGAATYMVRAHGRSQVDPAASATASVGGGATSVAPRAP